MSKNNCLPFDRLNPLFRPSQRLHRLRYPPIDYLHPVAFNCHDRTPQTPLNCRIIIGPLLLAAEIIAFLAKLLSPPKTYVKYTSPWRLLGAFQTKTACSLSLLSPCVIAEHSGIVFVFSVCSHSPIGSLLRASRAWRKNPRNTSLPEITTEMYPRRGLEWFPLATLHALPTLNFRAWSKLIGTGHQLIGTSLQCFWLGLAMLRPVVARTGVSRCSVREGVD